MFSETFLHEDPREWVFQLLARGQQERLNASGTWFDWLVDQHRARGDDGRFRGAVGRGVVAVLEDPGEPSPQGGVVLSLALAFVAEARLHEAGDVLDRLVRERRLTQPVGNYSDLHGRALAALDRLGGLDRARAWDEEAERDEGYAPLVFSLIRDARAEPLPDFLDIARLGFLRHAVHSIAVELGATRETDPGFQTLLAGAERIGLHGREQDVEEFRDALPLLRLSPILRFRLVRELNPWSQRMKAFVQPGAWLPAEAIRKGLEGESIELTSWAERGIDTLLVMEADAIRESQRKPADFGGCRAVVAVSAEGSPRRSLPAWIREVRVPRGQPPAASRKIVEEALRMVSEAAPRVSGRAAEPRLARGSLVGRAARGGGRKIRISITHHGKGGWNGR